MKLLTSIIISIILFFTPSCETVKKLAPSVATIVVMEQVSKNPSDGPKILKWMDEIDNLVTVDPVNLTLEDFAKGAEKVGLKPQYAVLAHALYEQYQDYIHINPDKLDKVVTFVKKLTQSVRNGVNLVPVPQK